MLYSFRKTGSAVLLGALAVLPVQLLAQDTQALQDKIETLQKELDALKKTVDTTAAETVRVAPGGGMTIGNTTLKINGYVKADLSYSNHGFANGKNYEIVTASALKALDEEAHGRVNLGARQSRIGFETLTPIGEEQLKTFVSIDFYGEHGGANEFVSNGYAPRLREAYGQYGKWLIGQTWSTFSDLNGIGELVAFGQQSNVNFVRQTMVRYTQPFDGGMWQLALENPAATGSDHETVPDIIGRVTFRGDWGHASLGAVVRQLNQDNGTAGTDSEWTTAYSVTGRFPLRGKDDIRLQVNYGNLGRYMGLRALPDAVVVNGTDIEAVDSWGASAFYRHFWTDKLRSTLAYSVARVLDRDGYTGYGAGTDLTEYSSSFVNLMYSPVPRITYGVEYQYFKAERYDGATPELGRLALSAQFNF